MATGLTDGEATQRRSMRKSMYTTQAAVTFVIGFRIHLVDWSSPGHSKGKTVPFSFNENSIWGR